MFMCVNTLQRSSIKNKYCKERLEAKVGHKLKTPCFFPILYIQGSSYYLRNKNNNQLFSSIVVLLVNLDRNLFRLEMFKSELHDRKKITLGRTFIPKISRYLLVMYRTHYLGPAGYCHFCLISGSGRILI